MNQKSGEDRVRNPHFSVVLMKPSSHHVHHNSMSVSFYNGCSFLAHHAASPGFPNSLHPGNGHPCEIPSMFIGITRGTAPPSHLGRDRLKRLDSPPGTERIQVEA